MNPDAANMSPLADIKGVRLLTRKSADAIYAMSDGGDLVEGHYQWVWNVATDARGEIRDLRWWIGEVLAPQRQAALTLDRVINFLLPQQRREFPAGEVQALLLVSRPTLMELRAELLGDLRQGGSFYPRAALVTFFQRRWLGAEPALAALRNNLCPASAEERDNGRGKSGRDGQSPNKALAQSLKTVALRTH